jgi:predicted nucleic acid-binding protein
MIVVSDTSPLNYLVLIDAVGVLPHLFGMVHAPPTVVQELQHPRTPELVKHWAQSLPKWLLVTAPSPQTPSDPKLDPGEAEAIALAIELGAGAILIDEKKGRLAAKASGLATLGTITVLELAAEHELLDLQVALDALQRTSFRVSMSLVDTALQRDAARKLKDRNKHTS